MARPKRRNIPPVVDLTKDNQDMTMRGSQRRFLATTELLELHPNKTLTAMLLLPLAFVSERGAARETSRPLARAKVARVESLDVDDFTCPICLSDDISDVKNQTYALTSCGHSFCLVCLEMLVQTSTKGVGRSTTKPIPCPLAPKGCLQSLKIVDIQVILQCSPKTMSMYNEASSMAFLEEQVAHGSARRCPSKHCNYTFEYEPGTVPAAAAPRNPKKSKYKVYLNGCHFQCPECKCTYCLDCGANKGKVGSPHAWIKFKS